MPPGNNVGSLIDRLASALDGFNNTRLLLDRWSFSDMESAKFRESGNRKRTRLEVFFTSSKSFKESHSNAIQKFKGLTVNRLFNLLKMLR